MVADVRAANDARLDRPQNSSEDVIEGELSADNGQLGRPLSRCPTDDRNLVVAFRVSLR